MSLTLTACGQALIHHDLRTARHPAFTALVAHLRTSDLAVTNFEGCVLPEATATAAHGSPAHPDTLRCLRAMGVNLLSLANNHVNDAGPQGMVYTQQLSRELGFTDAGAGVTLAEATNARMRQVGDHRIALIAMDTANLHSKNAIAGQDGQPGINPLRPTSDEPPFELQPDDLQRNLTAIRQASLQADHVFISLHEHLWPGAWADIAYRDQWRDDWKQVLPWKRSFAHQAIDAGASAVLCHGSPRFAGIEIYRGRIICHSLGNFVFHVPHSRWWPARDAWEGAMVKISFTGKTTHSVQLWPIVLKNEQGQGDGPLEERLYPMLAEPVHARSILQRILSESINLPTQMTMADDHATILLDASADAPHGHQPPASA